MNKLFKNLLLTTSLSLLLANCGGGGGGGGGPIPVPIIPNIISELDGSAPIISSYYSNISKLNDVVSSISNIATLQSVLTGPNSKDIENAKTLSQLVTNAEKLWSDTSALLAKQSASKQYQIYNSTDYAQAYAAYLYMENYVKPLVDKVAAGQTITTTELNKLADTTTINNIITTEKNTSVNTLVTTQTNTLKNTVDSTSTLSPTVTSTASDGGEYTEASVSSTDGTPTNAVTLGTPVITTATQDIATDVDNGNGTVTRTTKRITTTTTTTPKTTVTTVLRTITDKVYKNVTTTTTTTPRTKTVYGDSREVITSGTPVTTTSSPVKTFVRDITRIETVETNRVVESVVSSSNNTPGEVVSVVTTNKTVSNTQTLAATVTTSLSEGAQYVVTTYTDGSENTAVTNGTPVVTNSDSTNVVDTTNGDNSVTRKTYTITTTTTVTPKTTIVTKIRTYIDVTKKDVTTTTTTTPNTRTNYSDNTYIDRAGTPVVTTATENRIVSTATRTETITVSSVTENTITTSTNSPGVLVSTETIAPQSLAYSNNDPNLGIRTPGYNSDPAFYQTDEFKLNIANAQVNADKAYARGWTGKGVTVAVADTGYSLSNTDLQGQVIATRDYTNTDMNDTNGHGTHVLGTIVAKKNDDGIHGVAFDAKAIVIKIGTGTSVDTSAAAQGFSWAADQGATIGNLSANSNYDNTFKKSIVVNSDSTYRSTDSRYNYGIGQFYNMQSPAEWKAATDKGMIIVNAAGNQGLAYPANPGYFATATDASGNLLLGGKMLIVGAANQDGSIAWYSNRAGHICQNYVSATDTCSDKYKVSDFYIMAPGGTISTNINNGTSYMEGTSMAAPVVSGGLALLQQMWPYMKPENTVQLVLKTANKNIPNYDVNVNGQGLLDLDKATQPYGAVGIPTSGKTTGSASTISIANSGGAGSALSSIKSTGVLSKVMIVDEFARDFYLNMEQGITVKDKRKTSDVKAQQNNSAYLPFQQSFGSFEQGGEGYILPGLKLGLVSGKDNSKDYSSYITTEWNFGPKDDKDNKSSIPQGINLRTTLGTIGEKTNWLGNESSGALSVGNNNNTYFSQIGVDYINKENKWSIDLGQGFTKVHTTDNSLIKKISTIQSQSVKLGYENSIADNQRWGMTVGLPNYISKGSATISVPYATTLDGEIIYDNVKTNLRSQTPEKNLGLYYTDMGESETDWRMKYNAEYRNNIAGQAGKNGPEFGIQIERKF